MYPLTRSRRLRKNTVIRSLIQETKLTRSDFIAPVFLVEGSTRRESVDSMPGYYRFSIDVAVKEIGRLYDEGIKTVLLFAKVPQDKKDNKGLEALNPDGLIPDAIRWIKQKYPQICIMTDVAFDPYSVYGHDGIVEDDRILNDETNQLLAEMAVVHAEAGADLVAPSDMMDGRVKVIRQRLDEVSHQDTGIMSYSAKYASAFYGPFRDMLDSTPGFGDKKTYQMDPGNSREAMKEIKQDIEEGADIVMIKPALSYLDIVANARRKFDVPIAAYQVSGEFAMIKAAAANGWVDGSAVALESLISIKRAGADLISTYFIEEIIVHVAN